MINLIPYKEKKSVERVRFIRMVQAVIMAGVLLVAVSFVLIAPTWVTIVSRLRIATEQVASLENDGMIASSIDLASLQKKVFVLQSKLDSTVEVSPIQFVATVRSLVPQGITIDRLSTIGSPKTLEVTGVSKSREVLQAFIVSLGAHDSVASVDNPVSNFIKNRNGTFKLTVSFK